MMADKKKTLTQILGDDPREMKEGAAEALSEIDAISQDLLDAINNEDVAGISSALQACVAACGAKTEEA